MIDNSSFTHLYSKESILYINLNLVGIITKTNFALVSKTYKSVINLTL